MQELALLQPPGSSCWPSLCASPSTRQEGWIVPVYELHMLSAAHASTERGKLYRCMLQWKCVSSGATLYSVTLRNMRPPVWAGEGWRKRSLVSLILLCLLLCGKMFVLSKSGREGLGLNDMLIYTVILFYIFLHDKKISILSRCFCVNWVLKCSMLELYFKSHLNWENSALSLLGVKKQPSTFLSI